ncbi:unnamed protein product, partial [Schistosoma curassoni]|uniref:Ras-GEF domain-containing protein n=1 Tax=Schistosoma curassoni TaxID=6186 RepID=A0A183K6S7_9TREM
GKTHVLDSATSNNPSSRKVVTNWLYRSNPHIYQQNLIKIQSCILKTK